MASRLVHLTPLDPSSYTLPGMGGSPTTAPAGFTPSPVNTGLNVSAPQLIGSYGHNTVPPISGSNNLIARRVY